MALTAEQEKTMWKMLTDTRGQIGMTAYKDYVFGLLFYKYLSHNELKWIKDLKNDNSTSDWLAAYKQKPQVALDVMRQNIGYAIKPENLFDQLLATTDDTVTLEKLTNVFSEFPASLYTGDAAKNNSGSALKAFAGIFDGMRFDSADLGSSPVERMKVLSSIIRMLNSPEFDFGNKQDIISDIYEYLLNQFATVLASDMGQFYTPHEISDIMAQILTYGITDNTNRKISIYDPTIGSGSLLLTVGTKFKETGRSQIKYFGQEKDATPYRLSRMNLMMHHVFYNDLSVNHGDTLTSDWPDGTDGQMHPRLFDLVMANPPYSAHWDNQDRESDPRWANYGVAPKSKADYAFLLHCLYHLKADGKMAIVLPHGVLFRGAKEGAIRQQLLENHQISAIIGLPAHLFLNTSIPVCILILQKNRIDDDVLFVDASNEFEKGKKTNRLTAANVKKIVETVINRQDVDKYAHVASLTEIKENDYNLNIPRYVDTFEAEPEIDLVKVATELKDVDAQIQASEQSLYGMLNSLVGTTPEANTQLEQMKNLLGADAK